MIQWRELTVCGVQTNFLATNQPWLSTGFARVKYGKVSQSSAWSGRAAREYSTKTGPSIARRHSVLDKCMHVMTLKEQDLV